MARKLTKNQIQKFQKEVWDYYGKFGRHELPWRKTTNPYRILVSEIMLQQTQVERVKNYYPKFLKAFPNWKALAASPLKDLLLMWQGMGYNRRALFLARAAQAVIKSYEGKLPRETSKLIELPGIGRATAGAVLAYAYNIPVPFIETNVRRVFIYHFFHGKNGVDDKDILPLVEQTLPRENAREWYWALMDYGTMLKATVPNPNRNSKHYVRQSIFEGSRRQLRAKILKSLLLGSATFTDLAQKTNIAELDLKKLLAQLTAEGFINKENNIYLIKT